MVRRTKLLQKILLFSAVYQILIGILLLLLPVQLLNMVDGMEIFYPYISIPKISMYKVLGIITLAFSGVQCIYGVFYRFVEKYSWSKLLGYIIGGLMVVHIPTGTLFGILLLMELIHPENSKPMPASSDEVKIQLSTGISRSLMASGLLMINMPLFLLLLQFLVISMPIDMAFPLFPALFTEQWRILSWVLLSLMLIQVVVGALFNKFSNFKWMRWLGFCFALYQMVSLGIFFQFLLHNLALQIEAETTVRILLNIGGILGVLLNPIGLFYGIITARDILHYSNLAGIEPSTN